MRGPANALVYSSVLSIVFVLAACGEGPSFPDLSVEQVSPARGLLGQAAAVQIHGQGFHLALRGELDQGVVDVGTVGATIGGLEVSNLVVRSSSLLEGIVSAATPLGTHDVSITFSDGRIGQLAAGFEVVQECDETAECGGVNDALLDDPFADGTSFSFIAAFEGMVYFGPSADGTSMVRTEPDGTGAQSVALQFLEDSQDNNVHSNAAGSYSSIGAAGCAIDTQACGPDNEDGRGLFASATLAGREYLLLGGARSAGDLDYVYMTDSSAAPLSFRYLDMSAKLGPQTRGLSAAHVFGDRLYLGFPDTGGQRPYLIALVSPPTTDPGIEVTGPRALDLRVDQAPSLQTAGTSMIDSITDFNNRLYLANSGSWLRTTTDDPNSVDDEPGDWVEHTPTASAYLAKSSVTTNKTFDLNPSDKAVPQMATFGGRLYAARNTDAGPQLWSCEPALSGSAGHCDSDDWGLIVANTVGELELSQFDNPENVAISALVATSSHLYVAFDNALSGVSVFRSKVAAPLTAADFEGENGCLASMHPASCDGIFGMGLGTFSNRQVFSAVALRFGTLESVYMAVGSGTSGVQIYRLQ